MLQLDMRSTPRTDGRPATRVRVAMQPELDGVTVDADMKLIDAPCTAWEDGWQAPQAVPRADGGISVMLHGTFPKNCVASNAIDVIDRQEYVDRLVRRLWKSLGGRSRARRSKVPRRPMRACSPNTWRARCRKWSATPTNRPTTRWPACCS